jgi:putative glutamine amidotransferase
MKNIGIVGYPISGGYGIPIAYLNFFSKFGIVTLIMPNEKEIRDLDLLVLPGGPDVDPKRYLLDEEPLDLFVGNPCIYRERFDKVLLPKYIENKTPIFGICRGHQTLAVHFGGTLVQNMYHETNPRDDRAKKVHDIRVNLKEYKKYVPNANIMKFAINSIHHQIVDKIPENSIILASYDSKTNKENEEIEALGYVDYPAATVQWHPEEIWDKFSIDLIMNLLHK